MGPRSRLPKQCQILEKIGGYRKTDALWLDERCYSTCLVVLTPLLILPRLQANSTARSSFASKSIEDMNPHVKSEVQEELIRDVAANIYLCTNLAIRAFHTSDIDSHSSWCWYGWFHNSVPSISGLIVCTQTTNTAKHFMLAMSMYPEVQAKAQAELDEVFGKYQLPSLDDYDSLPYLTAVVKETLRWLNVAPLGVPHLLEKDDEYRGYILPKGSLVFSNTWYVTSLVPLVCADYSL